VSQGFDAPASGHAAPGVEELPRVVGQHVRVVVGVVLQEQSEVGLAECLGEVGAGVGDVGAVDVPGGDVGSW
jgi:hypothetical protein